MDKDLKGIKEFWEGKAKEHGISHKSSWEDYYCMQLEIETINKFLVENETILDIGCGNGMGTIELASRKAIEIKGIDYSEDMIRAAQKLLSEKKSIIKGKISFSIGDILNLTEEKNHYDKVVTRRVVINLGTFENQIKAAMEVYRILKPKGIFLMSEATIDGLKRINALRKEFGLDELKQPWHNLYIDENAFIKEVSDIFKVVDILNFSSTYYIGSRVIQPFAKKIMSQSPDYLSEINRLFMQLPSYGDYGIQKLFIFRKI